MKKTLLLAAVAALFTFNAFAQKTSVTTSTADTWVQQGGKTNRGKSNTIEIRTNSAASQYYYGLLAFEFTTPEEGNTVKKATLRLTTRYKKGDSAVELYDFNSDFKENNVYADLESAITTALAGEPAATFKINGDRQNSPTDNIAESYYTVDKWQNNIDVTNVVKSHAADGKVYFLLKKTRDQNSSSQVYSKEATDVTNTSKNFTFAAADLVPQLTVEYAKAETTAIYNIDAQKPDANDDIVYNLAGQRIGKNYKGIVIKNGKKILVK